MLCRSDEGSERRGSGIPARHPHRRARTWLAIPNAVVKDWWREVGWPDPAASSIASDTAGLLLAVVVTAASIQDRDAAHRLLSAVRARFSTVQLAWADCGYTGRLVTRAKTVLALTRLCRVRPQHLQHSRRRTRLPDRRYDDPNPVTEEGCSRSARNPWKCGHVMMSSYGHSPSSMSSAACARAIRAGNLSRWRAITSRRAGADRAASIVRISASPKPASFEITDRRHPVQVRVGVAATVTRAGRCQQSFRLPISQHVCRQPEPSRHLAD